ncbi:hypothetical protein KVV02_008462 [Mortierella alpina]|uniref:FAD-binding domain-containing protein n=1 Tax=Mortierella alpina TaxID=64518 RepID=A0A9P7ZYS1_MORAP|nr:hypothetical protein KVV02_008462 [Mortierella alpina]
MKKMTLPPRPRPRVVIVGAGLGGLMMGILLEKMDVPYQILERATKIKPLGSLMGFNANILGVFEQLGFLEEILNISNSSKGIVIYNEKLEKTAEVSMTTYTELYHATRYVAASELRWDCASIFSIDFNTPYSLGRYHRCCRVVDRTLFDRVLRYGALNLVPKWLQIAHLRTGVEYRPQIMFLPTIKDKGTVPSLPRKPSKRYEAECAEGKKSAAAL